MERDDNFNPWDYEMYNFQSPFYSSIFLLNGQSDPTNCQCNSDPIQDSYCIPLANQLWKNLHLMFKERIAPKIQDIHVDFYMRYDMWLHDRNSSVQVQDIEDFSRVVNSLQKSYMRDEKYR